MPCCFSCLKFYADSVWHFENSNHLSNLCLTRLSDWEAMPTLFFSSSYLLKTSEIEGTDSALCCWVNFNSLPFLDSEVRLHPLYYNFKRPPSAKWCMDSYNFTTKLVPTMIWKVGENSHIGCKTRTVKDRNSFLFDSSASLYSLLHPDGISSTKSNNSSKKIVICFLERLLG